MKTLTAEETSAFMEALLDEHIKPQSERIAQLRVEGRIAVVAIRPTADARRAAHAVGPYDGTTRAYPLLHSDDLASADDVTARWVRLEPGDPLKIFVIHTGGTLLVNHDNERGWHFEPGSVPVMN